MTETPAGGDLPGVIPVFPLTGALLLPGGHLPLSIFEPRYRNMSRDAMAGQRIIGMIQPRTPERTVPEDHPGIYRTGCLGRITAFSETGDHRMLLTLTGLCRFNAGRELPLFQGYRRVQADYTPWYDDLGGEGGEAGIDREALLSVLTEYLGIRGIAIDAEEIARTASGRLVNALAMLCAFSPAEKQALLEAPDLAARAEMVGGLMQMAIAGDGHEGDNGTAH